MRKPQYFFRSLRFIARGVVREDGAPNATVRGVLVFYTRPSSKTINTVFLKVKNFFFSFCLYVITTG